MPHTSHFDNLESTQKYYWPVTPWFTSESWGYSETKWDAYTPILNIFIFVLFISHVFTNHDQLIHSALPEKHGCVTATSLLRNLFVLIHCVVLPGNLEVQLPFSLSTTVDQGMAILEPAPKFIEKHGVLIAHSLTLTGDQKTLVRVLNPAPI